MSNNISSNSINNQNIEHLLFIRNNINNLKKDDNVSLFTLVADLDTDVNNSIDSNESVLGKILNLGENKLKSIAEHFGLNYTTGDTNNNSDALELNNLTEQNIAQITKNILKNKSLTPEGKKNELLKFNSQLSQKANSIGVNTNYSDQEFATLINNLSNEKKIDKKSEAEINKLLSKYVKYIDDMEMMNKAILERLMSESKDIFVSNEEKEKFSKTPNSEFCGNDFLGDGTISSDSGARQVIGNCWAHAGINSFASTLKGQEMIDNLVTKQYGIIAVKIPEAANNNLPEPKGDGIYTFTEKEIADSQRMSTGDGDVTAVMCAVSKYFDATGEGYQKAINIEGSSNYRMFELLTGEKFNVFNDANIPSGVSGTTFDYQKNKDDLYENLKQLFHEDKGAITTVFKDTVEGFWTQHAYSVVNIDNDFVYLGDSNSPKGAYKIPKEKFIQDSMNVCTYKF